MVRSMATGTCKPDSLFPALQSRDCDLCSMSSQTVTHKCRRTLPFRALPLRILQVAILMLLLVNRCTHAELDLPLHDYIRWSNEFGRTLYDMSAKATAVVDIRTDYLLMDAKVRSINGTMLIQNMTTSIEELLKKKVKAVQELVKVAEQANANHTYNPGISVLQISYHKAKGLNQSECKIEENEHFNDIAVNLTMSTVHVPTNVYDESSEVLNGVAWSNIMDKTFVSNFEHDDTLTWQYFCSAAGFLRNFPGTLWAPEAVDVFDCRVRGWYIQAAAYPKDVVVLVDVSGSMTGLRVEIAKATVDKILDTLSDDDFFNVIKYSANLSFVDECFNATMVQATDGNKERIKEALRENTKTENIAHLDVALTTAFELLKATNESGSQCNKAIMIVTDGAPETYEEIFRRYNWPRMDVRIFTYLIGREVGDSRNVRWMACRNKGRFSHIASLADVHEHVQSYVHVVSRPMVIQKSLHTIWTNVYRDKSGLQLMTTVAQPVFDTRNETKNSGILLGVVGTDVPLKELIRLTPAYKLGVNGFSFLTSDNGYVYINDPKYRPVAGNMVKDAKDFDETKMLERQLIDIDISVRDQMVDRKTGNLDLKTTLQFDSSRRAIIQDYHYFFKEIRNTPFSLGIALPDGYGMSWVDGVKSIKTADLSALRSNEGSSDIVIAPWSFCKMYANETRHERPIEMLIRYLNEGKKKKVPTATLR